MCIEGVAPHKVGVALRHHLLGPGRLVQCGRSDALEFYPGRQWAGDGGHQFWGGTGTAFACESSRSYAKRGAEKD
eukprot:5982549-Amphidinium_carterae.2